MSNWAEKWTQEDQKLLEAAIRSPNYIHSRFRVFRRSLEGGYVTIYHKSISSPSGKIAVMGALPSIADATLKKLGKTSPLSPTEMLGEVS